MVYERPISTVTTPFFPDVEDAFAERNQVTSRGIAVLPRMR